jgi:hypothetical protein
MFHVCSISLFYEFYSVEVSLLFSWYQTNFEPYGNLYSFACSQYFKTVISQVNGRKYTSSILFQICPEQCEGTFTPCDLLCTIRILVYVIEWARVTWMHFKFCHKLNEEEFVASAVILCQNTNCTWQIAACKRTLHSA